MNRKVSVSAIETFASCPRKYWLQYIQGIPMPSNEHLVFGSIAHRVLEYITIGATNESIYEMLSIYKERKAFKMALEALKIENVDQIVKRYIETLRNFLIKYTVISSETKLSDDENVGVIDLIAVDEVNRKLLIIDYKFTNYAKTEDDIDNNIQLYMYAKLINQYEGIEDILKKYKIKEIAVGYLSFDKIEPKSPKVLASGKLSKAKDKYVTYETYLKAIEDNKLNIEDYQDHLDKLQNQTDEDDDYGFVEKKLVKNDFEEKLKDIKSWTQLINYAVENDLFPGRDSYTCSQCNMNKICKNIIGGYKK
jgi:CRISPR/Cas system-associated exonuclease Cas4 (RecB family)